MKKFSFILIFAVLLGFIFGGIIRHHNATSNKTGCPFMGHSMSMCPMTVYERLDSWRLAFLAHVGSMLILFGFILLRLRNNGYLRIRVMRGYWPAEISRAHYLWRSFWGELFSSGIINSRLYA